MTIQRPNRIKKKYLDENSVDGTKVLFSNNESFKALSADRTETELFKLNANDQLTILKIPKIDFMPVEGIDAVNKNYVDYQYTSLLNEAKIYTDAEKARATAAEAAEALARETADSALNSRILPIEKRYQVNRLSVYENNAQAYADGQPGVEDPSGQLRDGWYYTNTSAGQKINWYYFDGINNATVTLGNLSAYAVMTFDSLSSMPILSVYTKPTGSSDVMPSFAHSRVSYAASSTGLVTGKKYLVYFGENPTVHPELPRVQLAKSATSSAGSQSATEEVLTVSFGSNSGASVNSVKFMTESLGIWSSNYKHEVELRIRHASQLSLSSEITNRIADVNAEETRAMAAEAAEAALRASEDTRILSESKAYTDAEVSEEAAVRASEDTRVLSESKAYTDAETAIRISEDARVLSDANAYTDMKVYEEAELRISEDARVLSDANAYTDMKVYEEAELRISEDARILSEANAYTDSEVSEEAELRISEDVRILSESKAYTDMEISEETAIRSSEDALVLSQSKAYTDMETARAMTAEAAEAATRASEDVRILSESKTYTDMEINTHVSSKLGQQNGIATLDSFGKLYTSQLPSLAITDVYVVEYIADRDAITYQMGDVVKVTKAIQSASGEWLARTYIATDNGTWLDIVTESDVDTVNGQTGTVVLTTDDIAEGYDNKYFTDSRAQSAVVVNTLAGNEMDHAPSVSSVNSLVDSFGERIAVDSFVVTSQIIANNYIELQNKAFSMSIVPSIDRLLLLEGDDYVVSVVSGKTRLTFQNSLLQGYEEALEVGDKIKIRYLKDIR